MQSIMRLMGGGPSSDAFPRALSRGDRSGYASAELLISGEHRCIVSRATAERDSFRSEVRRLVWIW